MGHERVEFENHKKKISPILFIRLVEGTENKCLADGGGKKNERDIKKKKKKCVIYLRLRTQEIRNCDKYIMIYLKKKKKSLSVKLY